ETRREHQRFMERLKGRSAEDRARLHQEHAAYLAGTREADADFGDVQDPEPVPAAKRTTSRVALRPPVGKNVSYLRAQRQHVVQTQQAIAAKTIAGSGKKRLVARKMTGDEEDDDYYPEEDDDEDEDEEGD
ncbi:hypothetical protein PHYSODRAFT_448400, partial [Phytophthora sojae]